MLSTTLRPRRTVRALAAGTLLLALAAGCGTTGQGADEQPAADEPGTAQDDAADDSADDAADGADDSADDADKSDDAGKSDDADEADDAAGSAAAPLPEDADLATETMPIPLEEALAIAEEAAGGTGELEQISLDHDDDRWEWELELVVDGTTHELDIDATTGEVTDHERDDDDDDDIAVDPTSPMTPEEAMRLATDAAPGRVSGWELDSDDGTIRYEIDIERSGGDDVDVEVEVESGKVSVDD